MNNQISTKKFLFNSLATVLLLLLILPSIPSTSFADGPTLTRGEIIDEAELFRDHQWTPSELNKFHGTDPAGIRLETPDQGYVKPTGGTPGWWIPDQVNTGIPYKWGGFSSLSAFGEGLDAHKAAGDIWTNYDESRTTGGTKHSGSQHAVGLDCSGLVSRAWRTRTKRATSSLGNDSRPIQFKDLQPGDILNDSDNHVMMLKGFITPDDKNTPGETEIRVIEASSHDWKVNDRDYVVETLTEYRSSWRGTEYTTTLVTLEGTTGTYTPRTYFHTLDIVLVIDRSGSMDSEGKMAAAKQAAKMFVDLMRTHDKVGVVAFDTTASVIYSLKEIDAQGTVITDTRDAIDGITTQGYTSIGDALLKGQNQLNTNAPEDPTRLMFLLSDGLENRPPYVDDVLSDIVDDRIVVHTVGLGSGADQDLLNRIADETGGQYRFSPSPSELQEIYLATSAKVYGDAVIATSSGTISPDETVDHTVLVDSTVGRATFLLSWPGSEVDLSLIRPDGTVVDPSAAETDPDISFTSGDTYKFYRIAGPQFGQWTLRVFGKSVPTAGEDYAISVTADDAMVSTVTSDKPLYYISDPIKVTASVEDSFLDLGEPQYMRGLLMKVTVEDPAHNTHHFDLHDDGLHGDGAADDGIYASTFTETSLAGSYNFAIEVSGQNLRDKQPFTRKYSFSAVVSDTPPEVRTLLVSAHPTSIPGDGVSTSMITAVVEDQYGNPIEDGTEVDFSTNLGSISPATDITVGGVASSTLTSGDSDGTATVTATADSTTGTTTVTFTVPEPVGGLTHPSVASQVSLSWVALAALVGLFLVLAGRVVARRIRAG